MRVRVLDALEAVRLIPRGATISVGGGGAGHAVPDTLLRAIGESFRTSRSPRDLTLYHPCGIGDAAERGLSHLAHPGLVKRAVGGFWGNSLKMVDLALNEKLEAYNFPQGVLSHLIRASASGSPGVMTKTGLFTFVDPRQEAGKVNASAREDLVKLIRFEGEEYLFFPSPRIDVGLIRGTAVDREGNLSMDGEVGTFSMLSTALAAKRNRGVVIAQVKSIRDEHFVPVHVKVPGVFIDAVVVEPDQGMTFLSPSEPALIRRDAPFEPESLILDEVPRIVARRAAMELRPGDFVNVGFGMSDGVPIVAGQEGVLDFLTFLIEQGAIGGIPTTGLNFGAMYRPQAILDDAYQFDYFHGAGLDIAFLGFAQVDREGNVNSSRFGKNVTGCGGFIDISQHAGRLVFCGTFAVKSKSRVRDGKLHIEEEGKYPKFVHQVQQVTFSGPYAVSRGQPALYVTERGVFRLTSEGLVLEEIAPGLDLRRDILEKMDFSPVVAPDLKTMDARSFKAGPLGLGERFQIQEAG